VHGDIVLAYLDVHTYQWTVLEFAVEMNVKQICFFNGSDLVVYTKEDNLHNLHNLSIQ
jgi:hypothetical protein